jgi:hypothetical protein
MWLTYTIMLKQIKFKALSDKLISKLEDVFLQLEML